MKDSIIDFPVTPCLMHALDGKFAWRNEKILSKLRFNNNKKNPAKGYQKHGQCLEKTPLLVKFLNHNFFSLAQNNNQEISALTCEKN